AEADGRLAEFEADKKAREEADKRYNERILSAEIKAAASGKLADPADAKRYLDLSVFEVNAEGDVDGAAVAAAIDALIAEKPYLAAQGARFTGTPDGGTRNESGPAQLTRQDIKGWNPEQIMAAQSEGRLD